MNPTRTALAIILVLLGTSWCRIAYCADEQTWGDIRGRFVFDGQLPSLRSLKLTNDVDARTVPDESLVVNPENRGVANLFVYLVPLKHQKAIPIHSSYAVGEKTELKISIRDNRLMPHAAIVRSLQPLVMTNHDTRAYNPNISTIGNPPFNRLIRPGGREIFCFRRAEPLPVKVAGSINSLLSGYLLVKEHPYATVTDENGQFEMKNFPTGEWTLRAWHERAGYLRNVILDAKPTAWNKGRFVVQVESGDNEMGDVHLSEAIFSRGR